MTNNWNGVVAYAKANSTIHGQDWDGWCEAFVDNAGAFTNSFSTAHLAYKASHIYSPSALPISKVPTGWLLWWDYVGSDGVNYGHVAFAAPGGQALMASGFVTSPIHSHLGYVSRAAYQANSGHRFLGSSPDHGGQFLQGVPHSYSTTVIYTVAAGDTLTSIGAEFGVSWSAIYNANKSVIGSDPDFLKIGEKLTIPKA